MPNNRPIGVFDSGVGGLTILQEIEKQFPAEQLLYFADSAHCPYGARSPEQIRELSHAIVRFLVAREAKVVVVACNTASVASLAYLRANFAIPFVGIVPAVKPAAQTTHKKRIGVLATNATFQGAIFEDLIQKFANDVTVIRQVCPGWVEMVEDGRIDGVDVEESVKRYVTPLLESHVDAIVLGCTHYPFLRSTIERLVGSDISVIDPAAAVARQVGRILDTHGLRSSTAETRSVQFFTTGDSEALRRTVKKLTGRDLVDVEQVELDLPSLS
ncbi:MAG: glutamate racemase [Chloroflexi bacterium]|nr:glutamate racemase [Chloroflexota bacterium]